MKVLLVGPYPPPHGGISVHVWSAHALMKRTGQQSSVLNIDPRAPESDAYIKISGALGLARELLRHAWNGWTLDVHTNGHGGKSWAVALVCGIAAQLGPGAKLTLHSGMAPAYIRGARSWKRRSIRAACGLYSQVICVNPEIRDSVADLGLAKERLQIAHAFLPAEPPKVTLPSEIESWIERHSPVITATMFFRPEYGFEALVQAVTRLKSQHPQIGCLIMGAGENREPGHALDDALFLAGDLDHELCLALMARSAAFVRPTLCDGDSISVREALALGVPVVASRVGTRPDGVLLFEPGDLEGLVEQLERAVRNVQIVDAAA